MLQTDAFAPRPPSRKSSSSEKTSSSAYVFLGRDATRALVRSGADGSRREERLQYDAADISSVIQACGSSAGNALASLLACSCFGQSSLESHAGGVVLALGILQRILSGILGVEHLLQQRGKQRQKDADKTAPSNRGARTSRVLSGIFPAANCASAREMSASACSTTARASSSSTSACALTSRSERTSSDSCPCKEECVSRCRSREVRGAVRQHALEPAGRGAEARAPLPR